MDDLMVVRDVKTGAQFNVPRGADTVTLKAKDGTRIKIHPQCIRVFGYKKGQRFDGMTTVGTRQLVLVKA